MERERKREQKTGRPLSTKEDLGVKLYVLWTLLRDVKDGEPFLSREEWRGLAHVLSVIKSGEKASGTPLFIWNELFRNFSINATGLENIPQDKNFIIASNHYNKGLFRGMGQVPAIAHVLHGQGLSEPRFIIDSEKPSIDKYPRWVRKYANDMLEQTLANMASTLNFIPKQKNVRELLGALRNDIVGIFPTGEAESPLNTGLAEAGDFFIFASKRYGASVLPIGMWHEKGKRVFHLAIGKPIAVDQMGNNGQEVIDGVMRRIASLLPVPMRGSYSS